MRFLFFLLFVLIPVEGKAGVDTRCLWLEFEKPEMESDVRSAQRFIVRFGEPLGTSHEIAKVEKLEAFYFTGETGLDNKPLFHPLDVDLKDGQASITVPSDGSFWYSLIVRGIGNESGRECAYTAQTNFLLLQRSEQKGLRSSGQAIDSGIEGALEGKSVPHFEYKIFYKRKKEDFTFNELNWSGIIAVINFNGAPFRHQEVKIFSPLGGDVLHVTDNRGSFAFVPLKDPDRFRGKGQIEAQNIIVSRSALGAKKWVGTYTIFLEPMALPLNKKGSHDHRTGLLIFTASFLVSLIICLILLRRSHENQ